jgi:hypothetical protein
MGAVRWEYCSTDHKCYFSCKICWYIPNFLYFRNYTFLSAVELGCFNFLLRWATTALYSYSVTEKLHSFLCCPYFVFILSTRYGKRTTQGILNDLWNALARYYLNNFADGTKQVIFLSFVYVHECFWKRFVPNVVGRVGINCQHIGSNWGKFSILIKKWLIKTSLSYWWKTKINCICIGICL